jgi:hypothetical protein
MGTRRAPRGTGLQVLEPARALSPTKVDPGYDHTRSALGAVDNRYGLPGARFWGQVRGSSGRLEVLQGNCETSGETSQIAGKARYQAPFPGHIAAGGILHGKEGVDGSSPSEGSSERQIPGNRGFLLSNTAPQSTSALLSGGLFSSPRGCKAPANRPAARYLGAPP